MGKNKLGAISQGLAAMPEKMAKAITREQIHYDNMLKLQWKGGVQLLD